MNSSILERSRGICRFYRAIGAMAVLLFCVSGQPAAVAAPDEGSGRVVGVIDGDTVDVLFAGNSLTRIRLAEIDAPEKNQPWGQRAKQGLSAMVFGKTVSVVKQGQDRYGRTIGEIRVSDSYVNREMVKAGLAWAYRQYLKDRSILDAENQARARKVGLWSDNPSFIVAPWDWRHAKGGEFVARTVVQPLAKSVGDPVAGSSPKWECGTKRYCAQMNSCGEAKYFAFTCGVRSLDGDGDGVPCERLCRQRW
jgi:endonuclease YncB( thermonuclease family)